MANLSTSKKSLVALSLLTLMSAFSVPVFAASVAAHPAARTIVLPPAKPACPHSGHHCAGHEKASEGVITAQGHGELKVKPDSFTFTVTQTTSKTKLAEARDQNNREVQKIISALKAENVSGFKIESNNLSIYPQREQVENNRHVAKVVGYEVTHSLKVSVYKTASPERLGELGGKLVDTAMNAGATQADGLNFFVADLAPARSEALILAVKDAQSKADTVAAAASIELKGLTSLDVNAQTNDYPARPMMARAMFKGASADAEVAQTPVETGEVTVSSDVYAKYKF
jgi:uncharacterized protein YggE